MAKTILTANDAKKIIQKVWEENDEPIDLVWESGVIEKKQSCVDFLGIKFYTYKTEVKGRGGYALVETISDNSIVSEKADYSEKDIKLTFLVQHYKGDVLENYIQKLRTKYLGASQSFEEIINKPLKGFLTFGTLMYDKPPTPEQIGSSIVCSVILKITYTKNVATGGEKVWRLDGEILPYLSESISVDKMGVTNNVHGAKSTQTLPTTQTKSYHFVLPYISDVPVCVQLKKDILDGDIHKEYTLEYYDGIAYTKENPFSVKVTLFRTSVDASKVASASQIEVWFVEADDQSKSPLRYEMALIDWKFDMHSVNTRSFESQEEQKQYFDAKVAQGAPYSTIKAPNIDGLTLSSQVYINEPSNYPAGASVLDLNALLTKNYAIIRAIDEETGEEKYRYYYFIQSAQAGAANQVMLDLRLDSIQTYLFDPNLEIARCIINKAHINRWLTDGNYVSFRSNADSPLFKRENYQDLAVRMIRRTSVYLCVDKNSTYIDGTFQLSPLDQFLKDNIKYWGYVYCSIPGDEIFPNSRFLKLKVNGVEPGYVCFCYPIYKENANVRKIKFESSFFKTDGDEIFVFSDWSYDTFWESVLINDMGRVKNELSVKYPTSAHILSVKISNRPPFEYASYYPTLDYSVDESGNLILKKIKPIDHEEYIEIDGEKISVSGPPEVSKYGGYIVPSIKFLPGAVQGPDGKFLYNYAQRVCNTYDYLSEPYTLSKRNRFYKNEIIGANRSIDFNPKLLSTDFYKVSLESADGQRFDYDAQKLGLRTFRLKYSEALTPDVTRGYLRIENNLNPGLHDSVTAYGKYFDQDFTGLVFSSDNLMPHSATQYAEFLAQNKNFFMQAQMQKKYETITASVRAGLEGYQAAQSIGQGIARAVGGDIAGGAAQAQGGVNSLISSGVNYGLTLYGINHNYKMKMLSVDNVRAAPEMIKNASGNPFFVDSVTGQQLYICEYSALDIDLREADDDMYLNGYNYNRIGPVKNLIRTRKYFNSIAAEIETISGVPMSNEARADIKNRFAQGLRFWHSDEVQYTLENYETYLE